MWLQGSSTLCGSALPLVIDDTAAQPRILRHGGCVCAAMPRCTQLRMAQTRPSSMCSCSC